MKKNIYSGKFIIIEGLDGSGQSTQTELLNKFLSKKGLQVITTKEPTINSEAGKKIRKALTGEINLEALEFQKLFTEDRREHLENLIIPALKEGKIVISDRYFFSTFAFGTAEGINLEELIEMNNDFLLPDVAIILKVSPRVCIERIQKRGKAIEFFEKEEKLSKVWETYKILPSRFENTYIIDGEKTREEVFFQIQECLNEILN